MIEAHLELAREMLAGGARLAPRGPPRPPIAGDELAAELGIAEGPELGRLLGEIEAAVYAGEVSDEATRGRRPRQGRTSKLAPRWRAPSDCLFCGIVAGDVPGEIVDSDEHTVAFMDINPATPGHALVVPRAHSADLTRGPRRRPRAHDRSPPAAWRGACARRSSPDGFNILNSCGAAAWQTVFHFHLHVIPRYDDDPLELPWVPRPGEADEIAAIAGRLSGERWLSRRSALERDGAVAVAGPLRPAAQPVRQHHLRRARATASTEVEGSDARALVWRAEGDIFTGGVDVNDFHGDRAVRRRASEMSSAADRRACSGSRRSRSRPWPWSTASA